MSKIIYTKDYKYNIIKYWRQYYPVWDIPKGYHVHHIKPKCTFDDKDDPRIHHPRNLIVLHPDDHQTIHRLRGDLRAAHGGFLNMRGYTHSTETRAKMKEAAINRPPQSRATKNKRSQSLLGKPKSDEHIKNIVAAREGWTHSEESKKKISVSVSGSSNGMYGKTHSVESINQQLKTKSSPEWIAENTFTCEHCSRAILSKGAFNRWHGANCKDKE